MTRVERNSFILMGAIIMLVGAAGLSTPFITILFSYLALSLLHRVVLRPSAAVIVFTVLVVAILYVFGFFVHQAIDTLPRVVRAAVPLIENYMHEHGLDNMLPFDDADGLKSYLFDSIKGSGMGIFTNAKDATKEFVFLIIGLVVAASLFLNGELDLDKDRHAKKNNLYGALCAAITRRFVTFYQCFSTVMGAQLIISTINTSFTTLFVLGAGIPHATVLIFVTFLCGMLPIVGNLISNTIIFCVSITISVNLAITAILYLIILHKFEYFLNSKIIGGRIRNPMWLTLLGLVVGEKLIGIPGMILAPVLLNYIKVEASNVDCAAE